MDDKRRAIMHHKFVVVDGQVVLTGSWNFTTGDTYRLNNNAVIIHSPAVAQNFSAEFEKMFVERKFGPNKPKGVPNPSVTAGDDDDRDPLLAAGGPVTRRWRSTSARRDPGSTSWPSASPTTGWDRR